MKKDIFWTRLIKRFYGISGELDEYREQAINRIGNRLFLCLWWYLTLSNFIFCYLFLKWPELAGWIIMWSHLIVAVIIIPIVIMIAMKRQEIGNYVEVEEDNLPTERRKAISQGLKSGIFWTISMGFLMPFLNWWIDDVPYFQTLLSLKNLTSALLGGVFFTVTMTLFAYRNVKKFKED